MSIRSATDGLLMAHLSCGCGIRGTIGVDQIGPDQVPVVRAEVAAGDCTCRSTLDGGAILRRHRPRTVFPLLDHWRRYTKPPRQLGLASELVAGNLDGVICIHAETLALLQLKLKRC